jgi:hypothetical protein
MAKYYSKRASKKRAYKKRRTIRKLKTTLRRKMQSGGGGSPEAELIKMILGLLPQILPVVFKNLDVFIKILTIILGSGVRIVGGGSKFSREQRGGGLSALARTQLLEQLNKLQESFQADPEVSKCIADFITKYNAQPVDDTSADTSSIEGAPQNIINPEQLLKSELESEIAETQTVDEIPPQTTESTIEKIKRILTKSINGIKSKIDSQMEALFQKIRTKSGMNDADIECLRKIKVAILADMSGKVGERIEKVKNSPLVSFALSAYENAKMMKEGAKAGLSSAAGKGATVMKEGLSSAAGKLGNLAGNVAVSAFNRGFFKS